jgi:hypothetical protein
MTYEMEDLAAGRSDGLHRIRLVMNCKNSSVSSSQQEQDGRTGRQDVGVTNRFCCFVKEVVCCLCMVMLHERCRE